jgi:hypothetical protein
MGDTRYDEPFGRDEGGFVCQFKSRMSGPGNLEHRKVEFFIGSDDPRFASVTDVGADD